MTAAKLVQCIESFSCDSLRPTITLPRGTGEQLHLRFVSSSVKDGKAAVKVDHVKQRMDASNFVNKTKLNPAEVGNSLATGILKQAAITDAGSRLLHLNMQATTSTAPLVLNAMSSVYPSLYRTPHSQPKQFTRTFRTMGRREADMKGSEPEGTTEDSKEVIREDNLTKTPKRRNHQWTTSYSNMTIPEAEERLGLSLELRGISPKQMIEGKHVLLGPKVISEVKREIYKNLVGCLKYEGYPTEVNPDFKEANINDIVVLTIHPLLSRFADETMRNLRLSREKEITSKDSSTSGMEEFVVMDYISYHQKKYVLIVEAKKVSLGEARKQCFLAMKDMWDCNGGAGTVYGFLTMGDSWRVVSFNGNFKLSNKIELLFDSMEQEEEKWVVGCSILIDCFNVALSNGAVDPVEVA